MLDDTEHQINLQKLGHICGISQKIFQRCTVLYITPRTIFFPRRQDNFSTLLNSLKRIVHILTWPWNAFVEYRTNFDYSRKLPELKYLVLLSLIRIKNFNRQKCTFPGPNVRVRYLKNFNIGNDLAYFTRTVQKSL